MTKREFDNIRNGDIIYYLTGDAATADWKTYWVVVEASYRPDSGFAYHRIWYLYSENPTDMPTNHMGVASDYSAWYRY